MGAQLSCGHCSELFQTPAELTAHNTIRHHCTRCNADFRDLTKHRDGLTLRAPFKCTTCLVNFVSFEALQTHIRTSPVNHQKTCMPCRVEFLEMADIGCHRRHSHPVPIFTNRVVPRPVVPRVQVPTLFRCGNCAITPTAKPELLRIHGGREVITKPEYTTWLCKICERTFGSEASIRQHISASPRHNKTCKHCGLDFDSPGLAVCHSRRLHGGLSPSDVPLRCGGWLRGNSQDTEGAGFEAVHAVTEVPAASPSQSRTPNPPPEEPDAAEDLALLNELRRLAQITATTTLDIANLGERFEVLSAKRRSSTVPASNPPPPSCPICVEPCKEHTATVCGHLFCSSCINQWIDQGGFNVKCPTCMTRVNRVDLRRVYM